MEEILGDMIYLLIFVAKMLEVSIATVRLVMTAKGNRVAATLLSAVEITLWLSVTSFVLLGLSEDPLKAVAYGLAFVIGIFLGMLIEDKLALGLAEVECIAEYNEAKQIAAMLREKGYGITTIECEGMNSKKMSIHIKIHRKDIQKTMAILKEYDHLFVTVTDIRKLSRGSIGRRFF